MPSLPEVDNKDTEEEWKVQRHKDTQLLDKNFSEWHDQMISEGHTQWKEHDTMTCDHRDPCKELKYLDPAGPPLDYMKHHRVFKAKKTNEYDLCHFYQVELSGDLPKFPSPCEPATYKMLKDFLLKAQALGHPNLVVAIVWDSATAICLLQELHSKNSLKHLLIEPKMDAGRKAIKKLSFCLLCMYSGSNNMSYMNDIVCGHYNANYGCGQCLKEVFTTGQQLKGHQKICTGFPKEAQTSTPSSPEKERTPKDPSSNSWPPPLQSSQESSPVGLHDSHCSKKKKSDSAKKSSREDSHSKAHKKSKCCKETLKKEKHHQWDKVNKSKSDESHKK